MRSIALFCGLGLLGCAADPVGPDMAARDLALVEGSTDGPQVDAATLSDGGAPDAALPACTPPTGLGSGLAYVRSHPMFISALVVSAGAPSAAAGARYFDELHANAVHLWETGLPSEIDGWAAVGPADMPYVSWVDKDGTSLSNGVLLGGATPKPGRIGYQIGDEPADLATLMQMESAAQAVHAADPGALTIINFGGADDALFTHAAQSPDVDVISVDRYTYGKGVHGLTARARSAALAAGKPYWRYLDSYYESGQSDEAAEADFRWDAYLGAAYGYTGATWFIYQRGGTDPGLRSLLLDAPGDLEAGKTAQFAWAAQLNVELATLGRTLTQLRSTEVSYVVAVPFVQPSATTAWQRGAGGDPYLSSIAAVGALRDALVGSFRDDCDESYTLLQNQTHPGADFPNSGSDATVFRLGFDWSGATDATLDRGAILTLDPTTGVVAALPLTATGPSSATVDVTLPAGAGLLWKYKNARPFVQK